MRFAIVGTRRQSPSRSTPNAVSSAPAMTSRPSNPVGLGGMVMRRSWAAIATAAAASQRSWASMNCSSSARSSALGTPVVQADRRSGRWACSVARARWRALLAAATLVPNIVAVSEAGQPSTSRAISAARCRGGSTWRATRNASSIVSRWTATSSGRSAARGHLIELHVGVRLQPRDLGERPDAGEPSRPLSEHVEADVRGDAVEPGPEQGAALERVAPAPSSQVHLLHRVLGLLVGGEHPIAVHVQLAPMPLGDGGEGVLVACHRGGDVGIRDRGGHAAPAAAWLTSCTIQPLPSGSLKVMNVP